MNIEISGHNSGDSVRQIIQLFFNLNSDVSVYSEFISQDGICTARAKVKNGEKCAQGCTQAEGALSKREVSDLVKKSVFTACRQISDICAPWGISTGIRPAKAARQMLDEGFSDDEIMQNMQEELWITPKKASLALEVAKNECRILDARLKNGVSLYIGIPFCPTRCAYCSFVSQAIGFNKQFIKPYAEALLLEIKEYAKLVRELNLTVETVYFGGGTPSSVPPSILKELLDGVRESFDLSACREFTVEAGRPDTFSDEMLSVLSQGGVDRISINPQTMQDCTLDAIGRRHNTADTVRAFEMAHRCGGFSINADLIVGLPGEKLSDFQNSLEQLLALAPDAVTVHTMYMKRAARLIDEFEKYRFTNTTAEMMDYAVSTLKKSGFFPYYMYKQKNTLGNLENVGFCKSGHEGIYNVYIMEEIQSIFAMGGGASSKIIMGDRIERIFNPKEAADYIKRIDEIIEKKNIIREYLGGQHE